MPAAPGARRSSGARAARPRCSSAGLTIEVEAGLPDDPAQFDYIAVCGGNDYSSGRMPEPLRDWLRLAAALRVRLLGISGDGEVMDTYVSTGAFDVLATPFHVNASWQVRSRLRAARDADMAIFVYGYFPDSLNTAKKAATVHVEKKGFFGFGGAPKAKEGPLAHAGTFAFLHRTNNWSAEAICLAYALTDPSVSSVMIEASDIERLNTLSLVPDRDMPPGLSAQIEMARVAGARAA